MRQIGPSRHPHRIHLKGPWQYEWVAPHDTVSGPVAGCVTMPAEWRSVFGSRAGTVRFRRRFHQPTNLEPHERVVLVFDGVGGAARVLLNGDPLEPASAAEAPLRFEITDRLQPANELLVDVTFIPGPDDPGGLWAPVALEIS